jgi:copper chaperone
MLPAFDPEFRMKHTYTVTGMTCSHCEKAVERALKRVDPQAQVQIDRAQNRVQVESSAPREALAAVITEEGYTVAD